VKLGVTFPDRRNGLVHIRGRLQLQTRTPLVEISFRREDFAKMLRLAPVGTHIGYLSASVGWCLLQTAAEYKYRRVDPYWGRPIIDKPLPPELRRRRLTIHETYFYDPESPTKQPSLHYTIQISRKDLALIEEAHEHERQRYLSGERGVGLRPGDLTDAICCLFSDPELHQGLRTDQRRPRGAKSTASVMMRPVRFALLEAQKLCVEAASDATVRANIQRVLGANFDAHPKRWRQNAIMIVSRAFRGAWERYHVKPPEARTEGDAVDVYRTLLPAAHRTSALKAFREHVRNPERVHELWRERLLGPEGQAARDFDLI